MANEHQFKLTTRFVATRGVKEYRATIPALVTPDDVVLEIGCEWGTTTCAPCSRTTPARSSWRVRRWTCPQQRTRHDTINERWCDAYDRSLPPPWNVPSSGSTRQQGSMRMWIKAFGFAVIAEEDGTGYWQYDRGDQGAS
jgi:hypothetical protein